MKALVAYYSRTGTTKKVAEIAAGLLKCDVEEIVDTKNRAGALGWLVGGKDAGMKKLTTIKDVRNAPALYDVVIIGTPVWAWTMAPAVRTYITQNAGKFKKVAFFCTMGGNKPGHVFEDMEALCALKPLGVLFLRQKEVDAGGFGDSVKAFLKEAGIA